MAKTVIGLLDTPSSAQDVVQSLLDSGFRREDISMLMVDRQQGRFSWKHADASTGSSASYPVDDLKGMGVPEEHANYYLEGVRRGGVLICIHADEEHASRASDILHSKGAVDIESRAGRWKETGWTGYDERAKPYTEEESTRERESYLAGAGYGEREGRAPETGRRAGETVIPVSEEQVHVGKREVERGGARIYTRVIEQPVEKDVTLREEHATVERRPVDRPIRAGEEGFREETIEVSESREEPVVSKEARVTEEVRVGKEATEHTERVRAKARKTKVEVEEEGKRRRPEARK